MKKKININYTNFNNNINILYIKFKKLLKKKKKQLLRELRVYTTKFNKNMPTFKKEFKSSLVMGTFLGISCIIFNLFYGQVIDLSIIPKCNVPVKETPDMVLLKKIIKLSFTLAYDNRFQIQTLNIRPVLAWVFNDLGDTLTCPIEGIDPSISYLYFDPWYVAVLF